MLAAGDLDLFKVRNRRDRMKRDRIPNVPLAARVNRMPCNEIPGGVMRRLSSVDWMPSASNRSKVGTVSSAARIPFPSASRASATLFEVVGHLKFPQKGHCQLVMSGGSMPNS
jgi:hypothetical protein